MYPKGIICRESALYYYGYTNRTPNAWHIAVEKSSSRIRSKNYPIINLHFIHSDKLHIGMTTANIDDVDVNIYDKERVICDCLINRSRMDAEEFNFAIKSYIDDTDKNIIRLLEYAKKFKIERKIYEVISIWL
jgi:predicted transcriptional regulator of viral defense system